MMRRKKGLRRQAAAGILAAVLTMAPAMQAAAEEYYDDSYEYYDDSGEYYDYEEDYGESYAEDDSGEEEEEYIPETYYEPIQTNSLTGWPEGQAVQAASAIVMDMETGVELYGKNVYDAHYPASITKIMTLLVAVENSSPDDRFACSAEVYNIEADSSNAGIAPDEILTMDEALTGLMLESANDLGMAIAVQIAGSIGAFADMMNAKAASLGCVNTHFANPHGLHNDDHYTCAYDMALIAKAAYNNEQARHYMSMVEGNIPPTNMTEETRYFINHHRMLWDDDYYEDWCTGGKTGYTNAAGNTLVTFGEKNGLQLVCVLMQENGAGRAYMETSDLMNYGFDNFQHQTVGTEMESPTFAQILGLNYPNPEGRLFRPEQMDEKVMKIGQPGYVTLPLSLSGADLTARANDQAPGEVDYYYEDHYVGKGSISVTPVPTGIVCPFEEKRDMEAILSKAEEEKKYGDIEETAQRAFENIKTFSSGKVEEVKEVVANNRMTVILIGGFILFVLLILIAILIMRLSSDYRIRRKRKIAERQRRKREEEIERKSAAEIEQELREAMEAERLERELEQRRQEEQRRAQEEARETEDVLEEIERLRRGE